MAFKIHTVFLFLIFLLLSLIAPTFSGSLRRHHRHSPYPRRAILSSVSPSRSHPPITASLQFLSSLSLLSPSPDPIQETIDAGQWSLLQESIGVSAMHMQLLHNNKVVIFDRTDLGPSNLTLPPGVCQSNNVAFPLDCTLHSLLYDVVSNTFRPLMVQTDVWCSSGAADSLGTLIQTGGYNAGNRKIRFFTPCEDDQCEWTELRQNLTTQRWYASDHILPDGRVIVVGGRRAFSYEFFPKNLYNDTVYYFPFLKETSDPEEENNLYPFLFVLPDGNLFVFANKRSVVLDYKNNRIIRKFPPIPGEKRSYPAAGSSVMLPLKLTPGFAFPAVEVMVCGGAPGGAYVKALQGFYVEASRTCGRIRVTDGDPKWEMEFMPMGRVMSDMILLPTGDVIILNGAGRGSAGWECAVDPVLHPVMYYTDEPDPSMRFGVLNPSGIPRMYHSAAILLPDGRILVGGSNPHATYNFTDPAYPTELSLEAFSPPYKAAESSHLRPSVLSIEGAKGNLLSYGQPFAVTFTLGLQAPPPLWHWGDFIITMVAPPFATHSFGMNQRLLELYVANAQQLSSFGFKVTAYAPPTANIAPPGYYMLFVVHQGVPSHAVWIRMGYE